MLLRILLRTLYSVTRPCLHDLFLHLFPIKYVSDTYRKYHLHDTIEEPIPIGDRARIAPSTVSPGIFHNEVTPKFHHFDIALRHVCMCVYEYATPCSVQAKGTHNAPGPVGSSSKPLHSIYEWKVWVMHSGQHAVHGGTYGTDGDGYGVWYEPREKHT